MKGQQYSACCKRTPTLPVCPLVPSPNRPLAITLACLPHPLYTPAHTFTCTHPQHHPIFLERLGKLDGNRIEKEGIADETILAYHLREMEYMAQVRQSARVEGGGVGREVGSEGRRQRGREGRET